MGGRGASSGISNRGKKYGTEYKTILQSGNIKFVKYNDSKSAKTPMETMTRGRVYVTINNKNEIASISYYDNEGKRNKQIDLTHYHNINGNKEKPHTHFGYEHNEKGNYKINKKDKKMIDKISKIWYNINNKSG